LFQKDILALRPNGKTWIQVMSFPY